ncbi:hypothetical protein ME7_01372 [Bartonella birtlesii LL-WM9]|uniref:Uncharacterized protein n=1 Tax=Bartonella birtlesii LL-WM9 TaxID=1094552 RepID=J0PRA4_9HYPH|nr:hypothetical protein ME7_01372 [Bartonella birtlesii LL-WM9]
MKQRVFGKYVLYRIQALKDFSDIKAGILGSYIEKESTTFLMREITGSMAMPM